MNTPIVEKVAKLLALAAEESGGTEGERNLAAERAQSLMVKYRIEEADLAGLAGREALPGIERVRLGKFGMGQRWRGQLMDVIGHGVGVDAIYRPGVSSTDWELVGRPDAIAYVQLVHDWLVPQLEAECAAALAKAKEEDWESLYGWCYNNSEKANVTIAFKRSFFEAAVERIDTRLELARAKDAEPGTDLVLNDKAAKAEFYGDWAPKEVAGRLYTGSGSSDGNDAGERVDLNPGNKVGSGRTKELGS